METYKARVYPRPRYDRGSLLRYRFRVGKYLNPHGTKRTGVMECWSNGVLDLS
jgi:hypothetical protein